MRGAGGDAGFRAADFVNYVCDDGTPLTAAFFPGRRDHAHAAHRQGAGRCRSGFRRSGARYAKGGVSFWIKGQQATLKRPKRKATICRAQ